MKLADLSQVPEGTAIHVEIRDGAVAICNVEGELYAMDGICPHSGGPLGEGALHGRILVCPFTPGDSTASPALTTPAFAPPGALTR